MKSILRELINRFYLREMPALIQRTCRYPVVEGRATILVGIRRCGKTYRCYQYMTELLKSGITRERLLYINFEDERLRGFSVNDFQMILDIYYERFPNNRNELCCHRQRKNTVFSDGVFVKDDCQEPLYLNAWSFNEC